MSPPGPRFASTAYLTVNCWTRWPTGMVLTGLSFSPMHAPRRRNRTAWFHFGNPLASFVKIWSVERSEELPPLIHQDTVMGVQFTPTADAW